MMNRYFLTALVLANMGFANSLMAQAGLAGLGSSDAPVSISADNGIEWDQEAKTYIAKGNAQAAQGDFFVAASDLIAHYNEVQDGNPDVYKIIAEGDIFIESGSDMLTGDKLVYMVHDEHATITGKLILLQSAQGQLSAKEKLIYDGKKLVAEATGDPQISQGTNIVTADKIKAYFLPKDTSANSTPGGSQRGSGQIKMVEARGNVFVTNGQASCNANDADYDVSREIANLTGNVSCSQCGSQLIGDKAVMDMRGGKATVTTNPGPESNGRIYVLIDPQSDKRGC